MAEWDIVIVISALVGLFIAVGKPIINLNNSITSLITVVEELKKDTEKIEKENKCDHDNMWSRHRGHDEKIANHEYRIKHLEEK